ncbi:hypothetical protein [Anabaena sp. CCY 9402-a]|uniref:hypothetical protein n=1 Tax=Anabaena sp. CCY 9402-a TaxID=3103867 RepID=UPI0039C6B156
MHIFDTQIISYSFKGLYHNSISQQYIASITAQEFLLIQSDYPTKANYYVPLPNNLKLLPDDKGFPKRDHPFSKGLTDQIILEFAQDYPTVIEFGNLAIADIINTQEKYLFNEAIRFLEKPIRKIIWSRFNFLLDCNVKCIPLSQSTLELGIKLFYEFTLSHNTKQKYRNTVNDVLILATAINSSAVLITQDSLLKRFASEYYNALIKEDKEFISLDFRSFSDDGRSKSRESKGYINKGWQVRMQNYTGIW